MSRSNQSGLTWTSHTIAPLNLKPIERLIIRRLGMCLDDLKKAAIRPRNKISTLRQASGEKTSTPTNVIMEALTMLGWELKYNVYSHFLSDKFRRGHSIFKHREWLYDLHWYTEDVRQQELPHEFGYRIETLPLVVECEWEYISAAERDKCGKKGKQPDVYGAVKYDFQKLVVANAEVRLMIFQQRRNFELNRYFIDVIENYIHLDKGANFLFVRFPRNKKSFEYCAYEKKAKRQPLPKPNVIIP